MRGQLYQIILILLLAVTGLFFGVFLHREIYPEYKVYQETYVALENFRSSLTHEPSPPFDIGIKQIVITREGGAPEIIDRCTSCHVTLELEHFSPTKIARDVNGAIMRDVDGIPLQVPNENYIWKQLDDRIAFLRDRELNAKLISQGLEWQVTERTQEAQTLQDLKIQEVNGRKVDMSEVLRMHPLIGKELRPFELHPIEEIGCVACHNGNGRALTSEKAHGPVFDGTYDAAHEGFSPVFTETDPDNDPKFARIFNHKPGHTLLFQTTPIFVGGLIEANCIQCHRSGSSQIESAVNTIAYVKNRGIQQTSLLATEVEQSKKALQSLLTLQRSLDQNGLEVTTQNLKRDQEDYTRPADERASITAQLNYIENLNVAALRSKIHTDLKSLLGSEELIDQLALLEETESGLDAFLETASAHPDATGTLFRLLKASDRHADLMQTVEETDGSIIQLSHPSTHSFVSDIDPLTQTYRRGQDLFLSQACYACHRISGYSRGGVGPELTQEGLSYPWFVKQSIVWPQADLKTSTMPNMHLDHNEVEALVTFLMGQRGRTRAVSQVDYHIDLKQWEEGKKLPWERSLEAVDIRDIDKSMTIFASEGCAACHRLLGFTSDVGYAVERDSKASFDDIYDEKQWFRNLIPELVGNEDIPGSHIARALEMHAEDFDRRVVNDVRQNSLLERIDGQHPGLLESFYSNFAYASRAKDHLFQGEQLKEWKERVRKAMLMYIQEYGLGRLIGPRPNWSGVYRSDEWLMEHFFNPSAHTAKSIMPVFPFDKTKFAALTYMLDIVGRRNLQDVHDIWQNRGFSPEEAYNIHCAQCHGESRNRDQAPVAAWIYPLPKNLRNATFLRNLTKERALESILHGVKGTPMPPWGEVSRPKPFEDNIPVLTEPQTKQLVDWLFRLLPGGDVVPEHQGVPKWNYGPHDVQKELEQEGDLLPSDPTLSWNRIAEQEILQYYAALKPVIPSQDTDIFEIRESPVQGVDSQGYYIKKKYYTPANIEAGEAFFQQNCAVCHGNEGAGNGLRASTMIDAKPRMLSNLDWIDTRDDLRLLRSIKFGVPGTAMTPWGDLTSSLQRLQLVMFIRHLSRDLSERRELEDELYSAYGSSLEAVRAAQIEDSRSLVSTREAYLKAKSEREEFDKVVTQDSSKAADAVNAYQKEVRLLGDLRQAQARDRLYENLISAIEAERALFERLGKTALTKAVDGEFQSALHDAIRANRELYIYEDGTLQSHASTLENGATVLENQVAYLNTEIERLKGTEMHVRGQLPSSERTAELAKVAERLKGITELRNATVALGAEVDRGRKRQQELYQQLQQATSHNNSVE